MKHKTGIENGFKLAGKEKKERKNSSINLQMDALADIIIDSFLDKQKNKVKTECS